MCVRQVVEIGMESEAEKDDWMRALREVVESLSAQLLTPYDIQHAS